LLVLKAKTGILAAPNCLATFLYPLFLCGGASAIRIAWVLFLFFLESKANLKALATSSGKSPPP
jgi:hypothetical protein